MSDVVRLPPIGTDKVKARRRVAKSHTFLDAPGRPHFAQLDIFDDQVVVRVFEGPQPTRQHQRFIVDSEIEGIRLALRVGGFPDATVLENSKAGIEISLNGRPA